MNISPIYKYMYSNSVYVQHSVENRKASAFGCEGKSEKVHDKSQWFCGMKIG